MTTVSILLLAGGGSLRMMGPDKVLEQVRGVPLLTDRAQMCLASTADDVVVVVAPDKPDRRLALKNLDVEIVDNGGSMQGLAHSLQIGLRHITSDAVLIVLADMPDLTYHDLDAVIIHAKSSDALVVRGASQSGKAGHPVLLRRSLFDDVHMLKGDQGAAPIIAKHRDSLELVRLEGDHATADLDTPAAWAQWRENN